MISLRTAQRLVARHGLVLETEIVPADLALGRVLGQDIRSPIPLPVFDNSAMDGFALRYQDTTRASARQPVVLAIRRTIFAGDTASYRLRAGDTCRIMTGAPLPRGANTIIPKEQAIVDGSTLRIVESLTRRRHVRRRGEEVREGALVLKSGSTVHPGTLACLAGMGRDRVQVIRKPRVAVISTGDETVAPGRHLAYGQIYDSNSHMVKAMLRDMGIEPVFVRRVKDRRAPLARAVDTALSKSDVLVVIGGVSVGEHDYLRPVLGDKGVKTVFWGVRQKPGKPIYFGTKGKRLVFGLPGNPASAFTCFYIYVYPTLRRLSGFHDWELPRRSLPLTGAVDADCKRVMLLKGKYHATPKPSVERLPNQGSHMITSLAETDSLIAVPATGKRVARGSKVVVYQLPRARQGDR
ncbi:MAG: molybdopterin molybdotransferase MoeA [Candidatus Krumholzibacteria bacterium]|nr:molybdopterin molybdotransferase MoeA [Candidatus Krumholzibacteria bacterium]